MPRAVPTLGYPTRRAAFVALAQEGCEPAEIARRVNAAHADACVTVKQVATYLSALRVQRRENVPFMVRVSAETFEALQAEAKNRNSRVDHLARRLLEIAASEALIDAILDDGGDA